MVQGVVPTVSKTIKHRLENMGFQDNVKPGRRSVCAVILPEKSFLTHQSLPTPENNNDLVPSWHLTKAIRKY